VLFGKVHVIQVVSAEKNDSEADDPGAARSERVRPESAGPATVL